MPQRHPATLPTLLPRVIRLRDAPRYLGMDRNRFNRDVRPYLGEFPIGIQGVAFDRIELDAWVDHYVFCNGRSLAERRQPWEKQTARTR